MLSTPQIAAVIGCPNRMRSGSPRFLSRWKPEIWTRSKAITERLRRNLERERISRWVPVERYFSACLRDLRGDPQAVEDIRAAIDELIECRFLMRIGSYLAVLARALLRQGRIEEARETIAQAIDYQERQGERWCRPELQRVDASVLFHAGEPLRAEKRLQQGARRSARHRGVDLRVAYRHRSCRALDRDRPQDQGRPIAGPDLSKIHRGL